MEIKFLSHKLPEDSVVVFLIADDLKLSPALKKIDESNKKVISRAVKSSDFKGKFGNFLSVNGGIGDFDKIILAGCADKEKKLDNEKNAMDLGGKLCSFLNKERVKSAVVVIDKAEKLDDSEAAAAIAYGIKLKSYRFDKYFTKKKEEDKPSLKLVSFALKSHNDAEKKYSSYFEQIADSVFFARNLVSEPPNVIYPESYAALVKDELENLGVKVEILGEKEMKKLGMGALLGVGQGSARESRMVVMQWNGDGKKSKSPLAFVGKGVCFDTGGISIKPSEGMEDMKYDMAGSAAVVGLIRALAARKAKVNVVGVVGLVENMPDGGAQRPSDVVTSMSGQTIEVLNTDAEGRLVLADALWYTQDRFEPKCMVDLATLTGAITVALGVHRAGLMSNNDELAERLFKSGEETGERLWRLPMGKEYDKQIDSKTADVQNISNAKGGGSITAAQFLQRFVDETPWAHLDIAGTAWTKKEQDVIPEGATGFGVRLLNRLVEEYYEG